MVRKARISPAIKIRYVKWFLAKAISKREAARKYCGLLKLPSIF